MATSVTEIWNLALAHIGHAARIQAEAETTVEANHCRTFWTHARNTALSAHAWSFATARAALSPVTLTDDEWLLYPEWTAVHALPGDKLRVLNIIPDRGLDFTTEMVGAYERLFSNADPAQSLGIRYIQRVDDVSRYTEPFVEYVSRELAALIVGPIRKNHKAVAEQEQLARAAFLAAAGQDSNASNGNRVRDDYEPPWVAGR